MVGLESAWRRHYCCGVMQDVSVMFLGFTCQGDGSSPPLEAGWGNSWQVEHRGGLQGASYNPEGVDGNKINLFDLWASAPSWDAASGYREDQGLLEVNST